jgi:TatD DNase family protein
MKYIDSHCHIQFEDFDQDREEVIARAQRSGVGMFVVGTTLATSRQAVALAEQYESVWAIIGLHPIYTNSFVRGQENVVGEEFAYEEFAKLAESSKVIGIGECGFDYLYHPKEDSESLARQQKAFREQLTLARSIQKPVMLHMRNGNTTGNAYEDTLAVLSEFPEVKTQAHFFAGTLSEMKEFCARGSYISVTGVVTFAKQYTELVAAVPHDRLLIETDSPFVAPVPHRGARNEPDYVREIASEVANAWGLSLEETASQLLQNTKELWSV